MQKLKKILASKKPVAIFAVAAFIFFSYHIILRSYHLSNFKVYGIGKATGLSKSGSASYIDYTYFVDGIKFEDSEYLKGECGKCNVDKFFKVAYSSKSPWISDLILEEEVNEESEILAAGFVFK